MCRGYKGIPGGGSLQACRRVSVLAQTGEDHVAALSGRKPASGTAPRGRDRQQMQDKERSTQSWTTKNAEC